MKASTGEDQRPRDGLDRRRGKVPPLRYMMAGGRREAVRRRGDRNAIVVLDRYSPKLFVAIIGVLLMSLLDALLTLYLIEHGATELNPVMAYFLSKSPRIFTVAKYLLTSMSVIIFLLVLNSVSPRFAISFRSLFSYALIAFGLVIVWELILVYITHTQG